MLIAIMFFVAFDVCTSNCLIVFHSFNFINQHLGEYLLYMLIICIPYAMIYAIGYRVARFTKRELILYFISLLAIFGFMCVYRYHETGSFVRSDVDKYPPRMYYVSFTLGVSMILWAIRKPMAQLVEKCQAISNFILFIGKNTIWIYLWHVLILSMTKGIPNEPIRFAIVFSGAIVIYLLQYTIVERIILPHTKNDISRKYIFRIFCG